MYDLKTAFDQMGGFGRFQWFTTIVMCLARNGGNYMINGFAYLTMEQMYECRYSPEAPFESCSA